MNLLNVMNLAFSFCMSQNPVFGNFAAIELAEQNRCIKEKKQCIFEYYADHYPTYQSNGKKYPTTVMRFGGDENSMMNKCFHDLVPTVESVEDFSYQGVSFTKKVRLVK